MKSIWTLVVVLSLGFSATAQEKVSGTKTNAKAKTEKVAKPAVEFKTLLIERNDIPYGADETFSFEFKNNGKTPVIVSNVQTSCGCTKASQPEAPVQPKQSSKIAVKYDTKRVGAFVKTITVTTNVGEPIVLTIKGTVLPNPENKVDEHEGHSH